MSFVHVTPASFSFGAIRGEAEAESLGDDVACPHPSTRGGAKRCWGWVVPGDVALDVGEWDDVVSSH